MNQIQIVKNLSIPNKFLIYWKGILNTEIIIDFNPIIDTYNLEGNFCLLHFQARPKGLRKWGILFNLDYFSLSNVELLCIGQTLSISEKEDSIQPVSVLYFPDSVLSVVENMGIIKPEEKRL